MRIGSYIIDNPLALAPMVGVTDRFFRQLCRELGAGYLVTEMLAANPALRDTNTSRQRGDLACEAAAFAVQITGSEPAWMAASAQYDVARGAGRSVRSTTAGITAGRGRAHRREVMVPL